MAAPRTRGGVARPAKDAEASTPHADAGTTDKVPEGRTRRAAVTDHFSRTRVRVPADDAILLEPHVTFVRSAPALALATHVKAATWAALVE